MQANPRFKYEIRKTTAADGMTPMWQIVNARRNVVISTHETDGEASREVQAILADEAHPNFW